MEFRQQANSLTANVIKRVNLNWIDSPYLNKKAVSFLKQPFSNLNSNLSSRDQHDLRNYWVLK